MSTDIKGGSSEHKVSGMGTNVAFLENYKEAAVK